ncbi:hypothetical protein DZF95_08390 [Clavibacter michiganensis]|nr:hypothetical protein DZF95_08390 [Clavibacter michiganensis]
MSTSVPAGGHDTPHHDTHKPSDTDLDRNRRSVVDREKAEFGEMKFGSAFFGWLTATGLTVLLLGLVTAIGAAITTSTNGSAADDAINNPTTTGIVGVIVLLTILLLAYYCGGYVAGRMARFSGVKQGIAVWMWAIIITIVLAVIGVIAGSQLDIVSQIGAIPTGTFDTGQFTLGGILSLLAVIIVTLGGAILGGLAGMRYHRKIDRFGLGR